MLRVNFLRSYPQPMRDGNGWINTTLPLFLNEPTLRCFLHNFPEIHKVEPQVAMGVKSLTHPLFTSWLPSLVCLTPFSLTSASWDHFCNKILIPNSFPWDPLLRKLKRRQSYVDIQSLRDKQRLKRYRVASVLRVTGEFPSV